MRQKTFWCVLTIHSIVNKRVLHRCKSYVV